MGIIFMALTFTLTSFTCTVQFVGLLLVAASQGQFFWPIIGMITFSTAFASPFFLLALFPQYLSKLPKSGGWLNSVKVMMGFLELAAAFKFISNTDLVWGFIEFHPYIGRCKFSDCLHINEPNCALDRAVQENKIDPRRLGFYRRLIAHKM